MTQFIPSSRVETRPAPQAPHGPPATRTERLLAQIWQDVLHREAIGLHDEFFKLGGHSLLALAINSRINQALGVNMPLRWIFEHQTIAALGRQIEQLAPQAWQPIPKADRSQPLAASPSQQPILLLAKLQLDTTAYNLPLILHLGGSLNVSALRRSLSETVRRHDVLRTTFALHKDRPEQVIALPSSAGVPLPLVDLRGLPQAGRTEQALALAEAEAAKPFDLERGPLLRVCLWRTGETDHWLALVLHHAIMDGWSFQILCDELAASYAAFTQDRLPAMPDLPLQYADFAAWQNTRRQSPVLGPHLNYWKEQLRDAPAFLDFPEDFPRGPIQTMRGGRVTASLGPELLAKLRNLNRQEGVTLFMTLLAAYQALLYRHTGQTDLVVGTPVSNRPQAGLERVIGMFVNTLALRTDLSGNPSFRQLLERTQKTVLAGLGHQEAPFAAVVDALQLPRDPARTPLFQAAFNLFSHPEHQARLAGLHVTKLTPPEPGAKFDLELFAREKSDKLKLGLVYNSDLFTEARMAALLGQYVTLLDEIVARPERRLSELTLLTEEQREREMAQFNQAMPDNPFRRFEPHDIEQSIVSRFEQQVSLHENRTAIVTRHFRWTYGQLNQAANQVAHALLNQVAHGSHRVALLFDHDAPMVAAVLGVLKAGLAYVPLDPSNPDERLSRILSDAEPLVLVTTQSSGARASRLTSGSLPVLLTDALDPAVPASNPGLKLAPESMAYLLYTSGSTGQPKAVIQNHRNVLHFIRVYTNNLHIAPEDRLTLFANYCFDAAVMDIYGALLNGASLFPRSVSNETRTELLDFLRREAVTIYHSTPTLFRHLFASLAGGEKLPAVRLAVLGGEEVVRGDIELHREHFSDAAILVNGFGPTEATVAAQCFLSHRTPVQWGRIPIGFPVEGMNVLLLDEDGAVNGVSGEIGLRSEHVALGYWRQSDLTQAKFLPDSGGGQARLFRTGDYGRRRPDGALEFVERRDFQVKVRGFRVELGEIEAALRTLPGVQEAVVRKHPNLPSDRPLAAYVTLAPEASRSVEALRDQLRARLPDYMVPSAIIVLSHLPLLPNGKLDHRALPSPAPGHGSIAAVDGPRSLLEFKLTHIWQQLFDRPRIGRGENFFDLGGHSLLAVRMREELARFFAIDLPISALFQSPTIESLARRLIEIDRPPTWSSLVPLYPLGSKPPLFFTHGWGGDVFVFVRLGQLLNLDEKGSPSQPVYGLQAAGLDGRSKRHTSIEQMAAHYIRELRSLQAQGPYHLAGYSLGGRIAYEMAQQLRQAGQTVAFLGLLDPPRYLLPWLLFLRLQLPLLTRFLHCPGSRLRRWWNLPHRDRFRYFRSRWSALKERLAKNVASAPVVTTPPQSTQAPQLDGFKDYYQALASTYRVRPYSGPADLFVSTETEPQTIAAWKGLVRGGVVLHQIPSKHLEMLEPTNLPILAREFKAALDRAIL